MFCDFHCFHWLYFVGVHWLLFIFIMFPSVFFDAQRYDLTFPSLYHNSIDDHRSSAISIIFIVFISLHVFHWFSLSVFDFDWFPPLLFFYVLWCSLTFIVFSINSIHGIPEIVFELLWFPMVFIDFKNKSTVLFRFFDLHNLFVDVHGCSVIIIDVHWF